MYLRSRANTTHINALQNQYDAVFVTRVSRYGLPQVASHPSTGMVYELVRRWPFPGTAWFGCPLQGAFSMDFNRFGGGSVMFGNGDPKNLFRADRGSWSLDTQDRD